MSDQAITLTLSRADATHLLANAEAEIAWWPPDEAEMVADQIALRDALIAALAAPEPPAAAYRRIMVGGASHTTLVDANLVPLSEPPADDLAALLEECKQQGLAVRFSPGLPHEATWGATIGDSDRCWVSFTPAAALRAAMDAARQAAGDDGRGE